MEQASIAGLPLVRLGVRENIVSWERVPMEAALENICSLKGAAVPAEGREDCLFV